MAKASRVVAALQRDGWVVIRRHGSHRILRRGEDTLVLSYHENEDLGKAALSEVARQAGYPLETLRRML